MTRPSRRGAIKGLAATDGTVAPDRGAVRQRRASARSAVDELDGVIGNLCGRLVVSCQAPPGHPMSDLRSIVAMCLCAERGGAAGVRVEGAAAVKAAKDAVGVPVIGLKKVWQSRIVLSGGRPAITPELGDAVELASAGADIVAIEATKELRGGGASEHLRSALAELDVPVLADVSTLEEGLAAAGAGAQVVGTTLSGYTTHSVLRPGPDLSLVADLAARHVRTVAEGRISCLEEAVAAMAAGALFVVVGKAITDPLARTTAFATALAECERDPRS